MESQDMDSWRDEFSLTKEEYKKCSQLVDEINNQIKWIKESRKKLDESVEDFLIQSGYEKYFTNKIDDIEYIFLPKSMQVSAAEQIVDDRKRTIINELQFVKQDDIKKARSTKEYEQLIRTRQRTLARIEYSGLELREILSIQNKSKFEKIMDNQFQSYPSEFIDNIFS